MIFLDSSFYDGSHSFNCLRNRPNPTTEKMEDFGREENTQKALKTASSEIRNLSERKESFQPITDSHFANSPFKKALDKILSLQQSLKTLFFSPFTFFFNTSYSSKKGAIPCTPSHLREKPSP